MPIEQAAARLVRNALDDLADVDVEIAEEPKTGRMSVAIVREGRHDVLELVPWGGQPDTGGNRTVVWILQRATSDMRAKLRNADENFVDLAGAVRLRLPGLVIDRTDLTAPRIAGEREARNPFADRASRIARVLFTESTDRDWGIQELAEVADVSLGLTSYVTRALRDRGLVTIERVGRRKRVRLTDPRALVIQWTAEYSWRMNASVAFHAPVGDPVRFLRRLPGILAGVDWALTLQAGASLVAPHAVWDVVHVYVRVKNPSALNRIGTAENWEPAEDGNVVLLAPHYRDSVWFGVHRERELAVVSDLQLILDLWHYPVRGREQAEHLLDLRGESEAIE